MEGQPCTSKEADKIQQQVKPNRWTRDLNLLPPLTHEILQKHFGIGSDNPETAHKHKKLGYHLFKDKYVKNLEVKANARKDNDELLYLIKGCVDASMKKKSYIVYVHLNQVTGEVVHSHCLCKAGKGGCCKHVAALLFQILDYIQLELTEVPDDLTCTQLLQQWHWHKIQQQVKPNRWTSSRGGTNCCVPQCSHNSLKNPNLSFYKIPKDGPMQKRWLKRLKTKGLCNIGPKYKVCSAHFQGGKKTFENNIPTIFTVNTNEKPRKTFNSHKSSLQAAPLEDKCVEHVETTEPVTPETVEELGGSDQLGTSDQLVTSDQENLEEKIAILQSKCNSLEKKYNDVKATEQCLFRMERFIGSDSDFKFYTGFPDYSTFKIFFDYLSPACNSLIYHGSNTGVISTEEQKKRGRKRTTFPEQELFMVLARMRCGLLLQDLAHRYGMSIMNVSRIWTTWLTFLFQKLCALPIWPT